jgi:hypothetical protein
MARFVYQPSDLAHHAHQIVTESRRPLVAVAFWGAGIIEHLGLSMKVLSSNTKNGFDELRIILNLAAGSTNASVVQELLELKSQGVNLTLKQLDSLHAKVWIGDKRALIGSANASAYGLQFNDAGKNCWNEAAVVVDDTELIEKMRHWFGLLWSGECKDITEEDLKRCPRKGPPPPPRTKEKTPLSEIMTEDICPIKLTTFYGENSPAGLHPVRLTAA